MAGSPSDHFAVRTKANSGGSGGDSDTGPYSGMTPDRIITGNGLSAQVDMVRDEHGVPHIHASTMADLAFAQGYVMAADRLPQMDLFRHFASGTVAELFGALDQGQIDTDLEMRMQGIVLLGAFLKLTPYARDSRMSDDEVYAGVEKALRKYFGKRGDRVVQDNLTCVKRGYSEMQEIPQEVIHA